MSMVSKVGYDFYFYDQTESSRLILFPITPPKLEISVGSRNETIELINEGQVNILKSPALILNLRRDSRTGNIRSPGIRENTRNTSPSLIP